MDNRKKIIFGLIAGIIFIIAFILNLLFPPKPFIKSAHAVGYTGSFVITSGSLNQTIAEHDSALYDWLEGQGAVDENYTYNDFLLDLASAYIGSKTGINDNLIDAAIDGLYDVLLDEAFSWDSTSGFIAYPNTADSFLSDFQHTHGYTYPDAVEKRGNWYKVPSSGVSFIIPSWGSSPYTLSCSADGWVCVANGKTFLASVGSAAAFYTNPGGSSDTTYQFYQGSVSSGYWKQYGNAASSINGETPVAYSSRDAALADLFGTDWPAAPTDPVFNGSVYIDDNLAPINILDVPGNDGRSRSIQRNTDINNNIVNNYGGYNDIVLSPKLEDIPNNYEYELPSYPEIPHDLPSVSFEYPEIVANEDISEGLDGLSPLWVTLLTMGGSFIVLKVIL